jgi:hypothetical protein
LTLASGLSLYFVASNLIGIGQYALLGKLNWSNLLPGRKKAESAPQAVKTKQVEDIKTQQAKPALAEKTGKVSAKATKTVKATKPGVKKPTKMNPKPNK